MMVNNRFMMVSNRDRLMMHWSRMDRSRNSHRCRL